MTNLACETAFTLFTDMDEAITRARKALAALGFEVHDGALDHSLLARRPSFREAPAAGVTVNARTTGESQTTLSVRAWGKTPREACEALASALGVRQRNARALEKPGLEDLRGEHGYSLADAPARARRELFGGTVGQFCYSAAVGVLAALVVVFVFMR